MDGEQKVFGEEAVHFDQAILVRRRAVHDQEDVPVVLVQLRPLTEML